MRENVIAGAADCQVELSLEEHVEQLIVAAGGQASRVLSAFESKGRNILSVLLPGYFLVHLLTQAQKVRLGFNWAYHYAVTFSASSKLKNVTNAVLHLLSFDFLGALKDFLCVLPALTLPWKKQISDYFIGTIETGLIQSLTTQAWMALRRIPDTKRDVIKKLCQGIGGIKRDIRTVIRSNVGAGLSSCFSAVTSGLEGWGGIAMIGIWVAKLYLAITHEDAQRPFDSEAVFRRMRIPRGINRQEFLGNRLRHDILAEGLGEDDLLAPTSWSETFNRLPLEAACGAAVSIHGHGGLDATSMREIIPSMLDRLYSSGLVWDTCSIGKKIIKAEKRIKTIQRFITWVDSERPIVAPLENYYARTPSVTIHQMGILKKQDPQDQNQNGDVYLYRNQNVTIEPGINRLTGANGIGKTVLLKLIAGSLKPTEGEIRVCGMNIFNLGFDNQDRAITLIPQEIFLQVEKPVIYNLLWRLGPTLFSNEGLSAISKLNSTRIFAIIRRRRFCQTLRSVAQLLAIEGLLNRESAAGLSGGEKKLLLFLIAVVRLRHIEEMKVLLLDELEEGIDAERIETIKVMLSSPAFPEFRNKVILTASHDARLFSGLSPVVTTKNYKISNQRISILAPREVLPPREEAENHPRQDQCCVIL